MSRYQQKSWSIPKIVLSVLVLVGAFSMHHIYSLAPSALVAQVKAADTATSTQQSAVDKDLMKVIEKVESLKLDDSIFKDSAFASLQDYTVILVPQTPGRPNPFAPLSGNQAPAVKTPAKKR